MDLFDNVLGAEVQAKRHGDLTEDGNGSPAAISTSNANGRFRRGGAVRGVDLTGLSEFESGPKRFLTPCKTGRSGASERHRPFAQAFPPVFAQIEGLRDGQAAWCCPRDSAYILKSMLRDKLYSSFRLS